MFLDNFEVVEVEEILEEKQVFFLLENGKDGVLCFVEAELKSNTFDVTPSNGNVQNSMPYDFQWLSVGEKTLIQVDENNTDFNVTGLELTEDQLSKLNEILKNRMEVVG